MTRLKSYKLKSIPSKKKKMIVFSWIVNFFSVFYVSHINLTNRCLDGAFKFKSVWVACDETRIFYSLIKYLLFYQSSITAESSVKEDKSLCLMNFALRHKPLKTLSNLGLFPRLAFHESRAGACILFTLRLDHVEIGTHKLW